MKLHGKIIGEHIFLLHDLHEKTSAVYFDLFMCKFFSSFDQTIHNLVLIAENNSSRAELDPARLYTAVVPHVQKILGRIIRHHRQDATSWPQIKINIFWTVFV